MKEPTELTSGLSPFDWFLVIVNTTFAFVGISYVLMSPKWWGRCLDVLDMRNWTHLAWTVVAVGLLAALCLVKKHAKKAGQ